MLVACMWGCLNLCYSSWPYLVLGAFSKCFYGGEEDHVSMDKQIPLCFDDEKQSIFVLSF